MDFQASGPSRPESQQQIITHSARFPGPEAAGVLCFAWLFIGIHALPWPKCLEIHSYGPTSSTSTTTTTTTGDTTFCPMEFPRNPPIKKHKKQQKTNVACNADSGAAVALSAPRSAILAYFQPAGASGSLQGSQSKTEKFPRNINNVMVHVGIYVHGLRHGDYIGILRKSSFQGSLLYLGREESLGNHFFEAFQKTTE